MKKNRPRTRPPSKKRKGFAGPTKARRISDDDTVHFENEDEMLVFTKFMQRMEAASRAMMTPEDQASYDRLKGTEAESSFMEPFRQRLDKATVTALMMEAREELRREQAAQDANFDDVFPEMASKTAAIFRQVFEKRMPQAFAEYQELEKKLDDDTASDAERRTHQRLMEGFLDRHGNEVMTEAALKGANVIGLMSRNVNSFRELATKPSSFAPLLTHEDD